MPKFVWPAIIAGIGGLLPTIAKLASSFVAQPDQPLPHAGMLFGLVLFFVIGAVLSIGFNKDHDIGKALAIGISAPGIITNIVNGAFEKQTASVTSPLTVAEFEAPPNSTFMSDMLRLVFVGPALAQQQPTRSAAPTSAAIPSGKFVILSVGYGGSLPPEDARIKVDALGTNSNVPVQTLGVFRPGSAHQLIVSSDARAIAIQLGDIKRVINLWSSPAAPNAYAVNVSLQASTSAVGDFVWSLGGARTAKITDLRVDSQPLSPPHPVLSDILRQNEDYERVEITFDNKLAGILELAADRPQGTIALPATSNEVEFSISGKIGETFNGVKFERKLKGSGKMQFNPGAEYEFCEADAPGLKTRKISIRIKQPPGTPSRCS